MPQAKQLIEAGSGAPQPNLKTFSWTPYAVVVRVYPAASQQSGLTVRDLADQALAAASELEGLGIRAKSPTVEAPGGRVAVVFWVRHAENAGLAELQPIKEKLAQAGYKETQSKA